MNERERIELLMKCYDLSPSQFAERTGIQRASVSHILSGRNKASLEVMLKIYDAFPGVDMKWLMTGVGEVPVPQVAQEIGNALPSGTLFPDDRVAPQAANTPFAPTNVDDVPSVVSQESRQRRAAQPVREKLSSEVRPRRTPATRIAQPEKKIKEIRIYYSDGTYETLIPERFA